MEEFLNSQEFHEMMMDYRAASFDQAHARYLEIQAAIIKAAESKCPFTGESCS